MELETKGSSMIFKRQILVTGGAGFIGSHVVLLLVEKYPQYLVINLDKLDYPANKKALDRIHDRENYKFIQGDICDAGCLKHIFQSYAIDTVLNFAAQTHVDNTLLTPLDFTHVNVYGAHMLVNAAYEAGVTCFIHVSTDEVYGGDNTQEVEEDGPLKPTNLYAASKAAAEHLVLSYWKLYKVIPKFICLLERNQKCWIHGSGNTVRNFLYVTDLARAFDTLMHEGCPGEVYNIGQGHGISMLDLAKYLIQQLKCPQTVAAYDDYIEYVNDRPCNDQQYPMDSHKIQQLGWEPEVTWQTGIAQTIEWYRDVKNLEQWTALDQALLPFHRTFHPDTPTTFIKNCGSERQTQATDVAEKNHYDPEEDPGGEPR